ncbi:O-antigen ligase family protein [Vibrio cyclitrophicus]|uniref:O-antigen ligase family protein n=1 Tax=Vibrio cyclitrophicus TaxID=47951 RepID=UPI0032E5201B
MINDRSEKNEYRLTLIAFIIIISFSADIDNRLLFSWLPSVFLSLYYLVVIVFKGRIRKGFLFSLALNLSWILYSSINFSGIQSFDLHVKASFEVLIWSVFFYLVYQYIDDKYESLSKFLLQTVTIFIVVSFFQYINHLFFYDGYKSFSGFFSNRNDYAVLGSFFLAVQVYLGFRGDRFSKFKELLLIFFIIVTLSTKGLLSVFLIYLLFFQSNFGFTKKIISVVTSSALIAILIISNQSLLERTTGKIDSLTAGFGHLDEITARDSGQIRMLLYAASVSTLAEHPLFGVGINNAQFYMPIPERATVDVLNTQNNYSEMLLNSGIPGFLIYYVPLFFITWKFRNKLGQIYKLCFLLLILKFINDLGMKSYNEPVQLVSVIFVYYVYLNRHRI